MIEGIEFLKQGVTLNRREPRLLSDLGWFNGPQDRPGGRMPRQFRELFRKDDDFHANDEEYGGSRPVEFRDNWLVGKYWFGRAEALVDDGASLKKTAPLVFFSSAPCAR